jgi:hypothetical protein
VEFSPDLQTQEADATIKDDANNESGTNVESSERDTSKPEETPQNQEETSNLSEEIAQITPEYNVTGDLKTADTDNKAPDESSVTRQKVSHSNETKIQERKSDDKPVNGLQVRLYRGFYVAVYLHAISTSFHHNCLNVTIAMP